MTSTCSVSGPLVLVATIATSSATVAATPARANEAGVTLDAYVERVLAGPSARVLDARAAEGASLVEGAGAWPNPALSVERQSGPVAEQTTGSQDAALFELPLVFPGRLAAVHDAAAARGDAAAHERRGGLARLRLDATVTYLDVVRQQRRTRTLADARDRLAPIVEGARKRAEAGESAGGDRLRLEVELARLDDDLRAAASDAFAAHRRAEALAGAPLPAFITGEPSIAPAPARTDTGRAELDALTARARAAEHEQSAASLRLIPDVVVVGGPSLLNAGAPDFAVGYAVSLRVELPLFDRGQGAAAGARTEKARVDAERAQLVTSYQAAFDVARRTATDRRERSVSFARDVVPRADALFSSASKSVEVGGDAGTVLALVDAARTQREARLALIDLEAASAVADAELLFTSGAWDAPKDPSR
ncbi:MAG: TolC family protein [Deltaproteobacteria bacterium]|nr:TolC family protein [Deltaproteobacteria bacterium]